MLALVLTSAGIGAQPVEVRVDTSQAPDVSARELEIRAVIQEWYPRIRQLLASPADLPPFPNIQVIVKPLKVPASAERNTIQVNPPALQSPDWQRMLVHELTHVVQD
jgi:hypothetical protein